MKHIPIVICLVLGLTEGLCKHDRRSKIIYDPRQLMEELNTAQEESKSPEEPLDLETLTNLEEDQRVNREAVLGDSGSGTRGPRQFGRQLFQNPIDDQSLDQARSANQLGNRFQEQIRNPYLDPVRSQYQDLIPTEVAISEDGSYSYPNPSGYTNFRNGNLDLENPRAFLDQGFGQPRPQLRAYPAVPLDGELDNGSLGRGFPGDGFGGPFTDNGLNGAGFSQGINPYPGFNQNGFNSFASNGLIANRPGFGGQAGFGQQFPGVGGQQGIFEQQFAGLGGQRVFGQQYPGDGGQVGFGQQFSGIGGQGGSGQQFPGVGGQAGFGNQFSGIGGQGGFGQLGQQFPGVAGQVGLAAQQYPGLNNFNGGFIGNGLGVNSQFGNRPRFQQGAFDNFGLSQQQGISNLNGGFGPNPLFSNRPGFQQGSSLGNFPLNQGLQNQVGLNNNFRSNQGLLQGATNPSGPF